MNMHTQYLIEYSNRGARNLLKELHSSAEPQTPYTYLKCQQRTSTLQELLCKFSKYSANFHISVFASPNFDNFVQDF